MKKPPHLFMQDKTEKWERNSVIINKTSWEQYIISKRIRNEATAVSFGISWKPKTISQITIARGGGLIYLVLKGTLGLVGLFEHV